MELLQKPHSGWHIPEMDVITGCTYDVVLVKLLLHWFSTQMVHRWFAPTPGAVVHVRRLREDWCTQAAGYVLPSVPLPYVTTNNAVGEPNSVPCRITVDPP